EWFHKFDPARRPIWVADVAGRVVATAYLSSFYGGRPAYDATAEVSTYIATGLPSPRHRPAAQAVGDRAVPPPGRDDAPQHALRPQRGDPADQREPGVRATGAPDRDCDGPRSESGLGHLRSAHPAPVLLRRSCGPAQ